MNNNDNRMLVLKEEYTFNINGKNVNISEEINKRNKEETSNGMKKYMPIGSVVMTKNDSKMIMIIGFKYYSNNKEYDYIGCLYPFGIGDKYSTILFNHEQISRVYHLGYINNQERNFKDELNNQNNF